MLSSLSTFNQVNKKLLTSGSPFTQFTYTITGANYVGTPGQYPIQFNNSGTSTYGSITNFSISNFQGSSKQTTIYIKAKTNNSVQNCRWLVLSKDFSTLSDFLNIVQPNGANLRSFNCCLYQGSSSNLDFATTNILPNNNEYAHIFLTLNGSTGKQQWYIYSQAGSLIYTSAQANYTASTLFANVVNACFAKDKFSSTCYNVTIGNAGWYSSVLSGTDMQNVVNSNL